MCDNTSCPKNLNGRCTSWFGCTNVTQPGNKKVAEKIAKEKAERRKKTKKNGWW